MKPDQVEVGMNVKVENSDFVYRVAKVVSKFLVELEYTIDRQVYYGGVMDVSILRKA